MSTAWRRRQLTMARELYGIERQSIATHEAGHCVVGRHFKLPVTGVEVIVRVEKTPGWGSHHGRTTTGVRDYERLSASAQLTIFASGAAAERHLLGRDRGADGDDQVRADAIARRASPNNPDRLLEQARVEADRLVVLHGDEIRKLADQLIVRGQLDAGEIDALLTRQEVYRVADFNRKDGYFR